MVNGTGRENKLLYLKYWGKARKRETGDGYDYHLLPWHCLDVAAVGRVWLESDSALRSRLFSAIGIQNNQESLIDLICFFLAIHDFGKFDIRFQSKVFEVRNHLWNDLDPNDLLMTPAQVVTFDHGAAGYDVFVKQHCHLLGLGAFDEDSLDNWKSWIAAVTGHHGLIPQNANWHNPQVESRVSMHDNCAREEWFRTVRNLFGITFNPPVLPKANQSFVAGFCAVADWLASNDIFVRWVNGELPPVTYFNEAIAHCKKNDILRKTGLTGFKASAFAGVTTLVGENNKPRQIQTLIDSLNPEPGLTIIEATTGSGKTEAALALAWKLLDAGHADSIVFALPTQATADAMLERLEIVAPLIFINGDANLVLAHGKAKFNSVFANLKATSEADGEQNGSFGGIQCAKWISSSRKRVFLGQIGVCTIDQVLLSVLPVRHNFVRSFGVMKSVLIVDEIHAYDRYMYGLLEEVLKRQNSVGGSAILLSATLPAIQKQNLCKTWQKDSTAEFETKTTYPLVSSVTSQGKLVLKTVSISEMPPLRNVKVECITSNDMELGETVLQKVLSAVAHGATLAVVCNLVQSAQGTARKLRNMSHLPIDIFHARYRFKDRQTKESTAKSLYGKLAPRETGRILVATQVIEQSLDLDFDWLITQLCPVDLLFQRMGRLHRHARSRPEGFKIPFCSILINNNTDFGAHEIIYGDVRVLWRTREKLKACNDLICFPAAYREWIEDVYGREEWIENPEPDCVLAKSYAFHQEQKISWNTAKTIAGTDIVPFCDTDQNASSLTRGKEMGLNVVPIISGKNSKTLLDGEYRSIVTEFEWDELLNMNSIPVPASWKKWLPSFEEGYIYLPMIQNGDGWLWENGKYSLMYTTDFGLEKMEDKT